MSEAGQSHPPPPPPPIPDFKIASFFFFVTMALIISSGASEQRGIFLLTVFTLTHLARTLRAHARKGGLALPPKQSWHSWVRERVRGGGGAWPRLSPCVLSSAGLIRRRSHSEQEAPHLPVVKSNCVRSETRGAHCEWKCCGIFLLSLLLFFIRARLL